MFVRLGFTYTYLRFTVSHSCRCFCFILPQVPSFYHFNSKVKRGEDKINFTRFLYIYYLEARLELALSLNWSLLLLLLLQKGRHNYKTPQSTLKQTDNSCFRQRVIRHGLNKENIHTHAHIEEQTHMYTGYLSAISQVHFISAVEYKNITLF